MALWERLRARPLPAQEWELLVDGHPSSGEQRATGMAWDPEGIRWPAIAAGCTLDGAALGADEWAQLHAAGHLDDHEVDLLVAAVAHLSARTVRAGLENRLHADPVFALEMAYCGPRGIPHSVFAGWSEHDRDAALSWLAWSREVCASCGTHPAEWDPSRGGDRHAYGSGLHHCPGCEARHRGERDLAKARPGEVRAGTTVVLIPAPAAEEAPGGDDATDTGTDTQRPVSTRGGG